MYQLYAEFGDANTSTRIRNGTPQGGILSPFLWLVSINELLERLNSAGHKVICYADDLAVLVTSKHATELTRLMQGGLNIVTLWAEQSNLKS